MVINPRVPERSQISEALVRGGAPFAIKRDDSGALAAWFRRGLARAARDVVLGVRRSRELVVCDGGGPPPWPGRGSRGARCEARGVVVWVQSGGGPAFVGRCVSCARP